MPGDTPTRQPQSLFQNCEYSYSCHTAPYPDSTTLSHDCVEIMDKVYSNWSDLQDYPLEGADGTLFKDRRSYVEQGEGRGEMQLSRWTKQLRLRHWLQELQHRKLNSLFLLEH